MLERLVEPDSRHIAELNFRICLCLEIGSQPQEAMQYCQKAISVCQARTQRLKNQANSVSESTSSSSTSDTDKQAEIETLTGLAGDLEKKLEDLQQLVSNPKSILSEILGIAAANSKAGEKNASSSVLPDSSTMSFSKNNGNFDSPTISTTQASGSSTGVTHLGVVGRGVKRMVITADPNPTKKPALDSEEDKK
jgi:HAT1-interacting factor 1